MFKDELNILARLRTVKCGLGDLLAMTKNIEESERETLREFAQNWGKE